MKKKFITLGILTTFFAVGAVISIHSNDNVQPVFGENHNPHVDNYDSYTYSGNYYSTITDSLTDGLHGTLRKSLGSLVLPKAWFTYSGSGSGTTGKELQEADEDPLNSSNMILLYTRDSISKRAAGGNVTDWNREHVWPQDLSNGHWGKTQAGTDLLHLRPTWSKTNGNRGNTKYGDCNKSGLQTYEGMPYAYTNGGYFEPLDTVKGDVARILMYVWTAYYDYYNDSSLLLTKTIQSYDVLLKWHTLDKPDILEGNRNDYVQSTKQKNRNPFVDHPEYAWKIFGDQVSATTKEACIEAYPGEDPITPPPSSSSSRPTTSSSSYISSSEQQSSSSIEQSSSSMVEESSSVYYSSEESSSSSAVEISSSYEEVSSSSIIEVSSSSEDVQSSSETTVSSQSEESSEIVVSSSENTDIATSSINENSSNSDEGNKKNTKGCGGSIVATLSLTSFSALIGLIFVLSKKKK